MGCNINKEEIKESPFCNFSSLVRDLFNIDHNQKNRLDILKKFHKHPLIKVHDISRAMYMLIALEENYNINLDFLQLKFENSGAVKLFNFAGFIWGGLPYPSEHAELGLLLLRIAEFYPELKPLIDKMAEFQQSIFTHDKTALSALWTQEHGRKNTEITSLSKSFLHHMDQVILDNYDFTDLNLGYCMSRSRSSSYFITGTGCKSGIGAFFSGDVGIINAGPCYGDISTAEGFGIIGRAKDFMIKKDNNDQEMVVSFKSNTVMPHAIDTGFPYLTDAYCHQPIDIQINYSKHKIVLATAFDSKPAKTSFCFFIKGSRCEIFNGPSLRGNSLDSYKGPVEKMLIKGEKDTIVLRFLTRQHIQIFSLKDCDRFWSSDFLINIPYMDKENVFHLEM